MEAFSALLALGEGNSPVTGKFSSQRPMKHIFDVLLICAWTNGWANYRDAGDLRRHRAHYDVNVMGERHTDAGINRVAEKDNITQQVLSWYTHRQVHDHIYVFQICDLSSISKLMRKNRDYVYGIWQYKVLSRKIQFQSKIIWEQCNG